MGGKTATSTQQVQVPPAVLAQYQSVNARAEQTAQTPFQQYSGELVAPITPEQASGITATNTAANEAQPFYAAAANTLGSAQAGVTPVNQLATGLAAGSAQQVNPSALDTAAINKYMSPYLQDVVGSEAALLNQQNQQQQAGQLGTAIRSGAFGGDRTGIAAANLAQQQELANASIFSGLLNQGYNTALGTAQQQQGVGLSAAQANRAALGQAAQTLAGVGQTAYGEGANTAGELGALGTGAQTAGLTGAQAQIAAGTVEQQTQQAQDTALYNQFLQQQSYPFQVSQFLANIAEGTGALSGSTTTTQQPGGFFSDERLKEDMEPIGKTFDGQPIYRYRMKGDPRERIGLSAQKVERKHPEAVGVAGGYRFVDYGRATEEAANRGHFYKGGVVAFPRRRYATGGVPDYQGGLGAVLAAQQAMYAPAPAGGRNIPNAGVSHQLTVASGTPAPPPSGSNTVQQAVGLGKDAYQGYKWATRPAPAAPSGVAPASSAAPAAAEPGAADIAAGATDTAATSAAAPAATTAAETAAGTAAEGAAAGAATDAAVAGATDAAATEAAALAAEYAVADAAVAAMAAARGGKVRRKFAYGGMPYQTDGEQIDIPDQQTSVHLQSAGPLVKQPTGLQTAMKLGDPNQWEGLAGSMFSNQALARGGIAGRRGYDEGGAPSQDDDPGDVVPASDAGLAPSSKPSLWDKIKEHATAENVVPILTGLAAMGTAPTRSAGVALAAGLGAGAQSYLGTRASLAKTAAEQQTARGLEIANRIATMKAQAAQEYLNPTSTATGTAAPSPATPTTPPPQAIDTAASIDNYYRNKYFVPPWLPSEQDAIRRAHGAAIALGSDHPVQQAQAARDQRIQEQTAANQNAAQSEADQLYTSATDPSSTQAARQAALAKYNAIHQWTGDQYVDNAGARINSRTGAPAIGVAAQTLTPEQQLQATLQSWSPERDENGAIWMVNKLTQQRVPVSGVGGGASPAASAPQNNFLPGVNFDNLPKTPAQSGFATKTGQVTPEKTETARAEQLDSASDAAAQDAKTRSILAAAQGELAKIPARAVGPGSNVYNAFQKFRTAVSGSAPDALVDEQELDKYLNQVGAQNVRSLLSGQKITNQEMMTFMTRGSPNVEQPLATIQNLVNYLSADTDYDARLQATKIHALRLGADPYALPGAIDNTPGASRTEYVQRKLGFAPSFTPKQRPGSARTITRTGILNGRKVVQYSDGTTEYAE